MPSELCMLAMQSSLRSLRDDVVVFCTIDLEKSTSQVNEELTQEAACISTSFGNAALLDSDSTSLLVLALKASSDLDVGMQARWQQRAAASEAYLIVLTASPRGDTTRNDTAVDLGGHRHVPPKVCKFHDSRLYTPMPRCLHLST